MLFNFRELMDAGFWAVVTYILATLVIIFLILPFHEWAHAFAASKLGDTAIKQRGRLSLNPMSHIDYMGALFMLLFGFGWAKPVPVDDRRFKNPKVGMAITAFAGPLANIVAAFIGGFVYYLVLYIIIKTNPEFIITSKFVEYFGDFFGFYISMNCMLAVFNLLLWPPLDGSKILFAFMPDKWVYKFYQYQQYFYIALMVLLFTGILSTPISALSRFMTNLVSDICSKPFLYLLGR